MGVTSVPLLLSTPVWSQSTTVEACTHGAYTVRVDLYLPALSSPRPAPVVIALFGGGYSDGSRTKFKTAPEYIKYRDALLQRGIAVAATDMRLTTEAPFPAMLQDARCAVRYLRANARTLGIDSSRIGALGISSGGQVALLLALAGDVRAEDAGSRPTASSALRAAVSVGSPVDLRPQIIRDHILGEVTRVAGAANASRWWLGLFGAVDPSPEVLAAFSPITYLRSDGPPILFFQALADEWNHPESAMLLMRAMIATGAPGTLRLVPGTHEPMLADESVIAEAVRFLAGALAVR